MEDHPILTIVLVFVAGYFILKIVGKLKEDNHTPTEAPKASGAGAAAASIVGNLAGHKTASGYGIDWTRALIFPFGGPIFNKINEPLK